eukprot:8690266-Pyramimonas_sp.AAC.1
MRVIRGRSALGYYRTVAAQVTSHAQCHARRFHGTWQARRSRRNALLATPAAAPTSASPARDQRLRKLIGHDQPQP